MAILNAVRRDWQAPHLGTIAGAALMLALAACATPAKRVVAPPPPVVAPAAPKPAPLPEVAQNRIALLVPLTGTNAPLGQSIANAANLALLDSGDSNINLRVYDTAAGAEAAATKALADGAGLFLGPLLAGDIRTVDAIAATRNVPVLSFSNDASLAGGNVFVLGLQPGQSIARSISYARSRGIERFAALVPVGVYGQRAQTAFVRAVSDAGGRSTAVVPYPRDPAKMAAAARIVTAWDARNKAGTPTIRPDGTVAAPKVAPLPFQALLIADSGSVAAQFVPALVKLGVTPGVAIIMGTELWNNEPGIAGVAALNGALFSSIADDRFKKLAERYKAKFGSNPSRLASFGYDSVLLVNSIAGKWPLGAPFPRAELTSRDGFSGIDGAFRFTPGNVAERALEVQQISNGNIATIAPAPKGFGD